MSNSTPPPDWYPDPERPGEQRYWDGMNWTEQRRPASSGFGSPMTPPPPPPGYVPFNPQQSGFAAAQSRASWALAAAVIGLVCCGPLSVVGIVLGRNEVQQIDSGVGDPSKRGVANAAYIVGIIGAVLWVLLLILRFGADVI